MNQDYSLCHCLDESIRHCHTNRRKLFYTHVVYENGIPSVKNHNKCNFYKKGPQRPLQN